MTDNHIEAMRLADEAKTWISQVVIAAHRRSPVQTKVTVEALEAFINRLRDLASSTRGAGAEPVSVPAFDAASFNAAFRKVAALRGKTMKEVSAETGVNETTLSRMQNGRKPDAAALAALSSWAGMNPSTFMRFEVTTRPTARPPETALGATLEAKAVNVEAERERFEAFVRQMQGNANRHADDNQRYASATVQGWWRAWLFRANQEAQ